MKSLCLKKQKFIQKIMQASNNKAVQFSKVFHACFEASFLLQFSATMTFSSYAANKNPNKQQTFKPKQHFMHLIIKTHPYSMHSPGFSNPDHAQRPKKKQSWTPAHPTTNLTWIPKQSSETCLRRGISFLRWQGISLSNSSRIGKNAASDEKPLFN